MEDLLYWFVGVMGVPLINRLKILFGWKGRAAMWLTAGIAALLAIAAVGVTQGADFTVLDPEGFFAILGQILAGATLAYKLLLQGS